MTSIEQLSGHTTVQASAGSGKTYLLISRIVRLLLTGAEAGNILAITFTRKAANEMQTRLLERLFELATCDETSLEKILHELKLDINTNTIELSRSLYEKILRSDAPVKTSTFHAFCQELLRRFPMEANIAPGFDLLDKTALLYDEAWDALMAEANKNKESELAKAVYSLFKELGLYNSKKALINFIEHRSDWWAYTKNEVDALLFAKNNLQKQINIDINVNPLENLFASEENINLLNEFHILLCKHDTKKNVEHSSFIYQIIDEQKDKSLRFDLFKLCFLTKAGSPLQRKESNVAAKKMGEEGQTRFLELHTILSEKILDTIANISAIKTIETNLSWYLAGQHYLEHFQKIKQQQRLLDFTDLEWQTYLLLNQSNNALWVQYKLDQRIEHLLIDEFQDTNPTQWNLILPLLEEMAASNDERQRSVFIVGDAKQSIYRFRRAEPRLFIAAEKWLKNNLGATTSPLSHSWRSSPAIINFINKVFSQNKFKVLLPSFNEHTTHRKELTGKVTLLPLSLKDHQTADEQEEITLRNPLHQARQETINHQYFNEGLIIANTIKNIIKDETLISHKNGTKVVNYNDIIILLRSRTHVADYEKALRETGIPYIGANRGTLLESLEVNDMLDLLQWLILPFDNLSLAGILRSPLFNVTNQDLIAIKQSTKGSWLERLKKYVDNNPEHKILPRAYNLLIQWQDTANKLPAHDLLDKIYSEANVLACYTAAFPPHLSQRVTANLNRFLELALEMDSGRYPSLSRFSAWLNELRQLENEAPDEPVTPATEDSQQRIRILSIHAAKGLEAPIVFLADSANNPTSKKAYTTLIDWPAGNEKPEYFLLTATKNNLDKFSKKCITEQESFEQHENANLLYVALTRAKQRLYISGSEPKGSGHGWYADICTAFNIENNDNDVEIVLEKTDGIDKATVTINKKQSIQNIYIPAELSAPINISQVPLDISPSLQTTYSNNIESNEDNTLRGIVMHKMLNYLSTSDEQNISKFYCSETIELKTSKIEKWWRECQNIINDKSLSQYFDVRNYQRFYNEVPIQFKNNEQQQVYGIIDRIIIQNNSATIIDYKTHPYITQSNMKDVALSYEKQMQLYQKGVQLLWPNFSVKSVLLFTAISKAYVFQ